MKGRLREGITATDLVLTITQMLRKQGVVGKFVEFFGAGLDDMSVANRATISNMAPEYGATCGFFPVDAKTIDYLRTTGRSDDSIALVEAYCRAQGMFREARRLIRSLPAYWNWISHLLRPPSPGRSDHRTAFCWAMSRKDSSNQSLPENSTDGFHKSCGRQR